MNIKSIIFIDNLKKYNISYADGSFNVKILKRTAEFKVDTSDKHLNDGTGNSSSKLQIPKKSKVFLEQTIRERDNASGMLLPIVAFINAPSMCILNLNNLFLASNSSQFSNGIMEITIISCSSNC